MKRYLQSYVQQDLPEKIILLTGPRQCGKTTLAKQLTDSFDYFNYDSAEHRLLLKDKSWDRKKDLVIFDELHKMRYWKRWLKGIYDTEGIPPEILVTGSARLDTHRKVGDSLAGRYFQFRLHPLDMKEIVNYYAADGNKLFDQLWHCSGFPEPFIKDDPTYYKRWRRSHLDIILRQDLIDLYTGRDIQAIETLVLLLRDRVGGTISYANLGRDLERDPNTIKRWLQLLENLYVIFRVNPYHKKVARSLLKEPKYYFYDHALIENNDAARLENLVACALLKELQFIEDTKGIKATLHFLRTKDGKEIDFLVCIENKARLMIEVKWSDATPADGFKYFDKYLPEAAQLQLVKELSREKTYPSKLEIRSLIPWLINLDFDSIGDT
jgi:predicted AAA+ superfamily ATPase